MSAVVEVERPTPAGRPRLRIQRGDRVLFRHRIVGARVSIGRSDACDIALPSDTVSRTHCTVEERSGGWWLIDRSSHGTWVEGERVEQRPIGAGDCFSVVEYTLSFQLGGEREDEATRTRLVRGAEHEELVDIGADSVRVWRARILVMDGPLEGESFDLTRARTRIGGDGAHIVIDSELPRDATILRVVRGRVMVEPGSHPVFLAGLRVRELTPVMPGEALRIGGCKVQVEARIASGSERGLEAFGELVGRSKKMRDVFGVLQRVARHEATALILGESGTGKELAARALHDGSPRADGAFVPINCASMPSELVESELFGHEAGAFTGASKRRDGAFQRAHGGTLFLDELGELSADVQAKLLRALESGEVRRVGGSHTEHPDVRVVAATHRNLAKMARDGEFRQDLLFRLGVLTVQIPALRDHSEDIPMLARTLLDRHHAGARIGRDGVRKLMSHHWPGNVRELRNVLTRAVVMHGHVVRAEHLTLNPFGCETGPGFSAEDHERQQLVEVLDRVQGNRAAAARELGVPRTSLLYKLRKHGLT